MDWRRSRGGSSRLAFVKHAIISATDKPGGVNIIYLDGMNNPGFSGGPVIFNPNGDSQKPQVCGVISGYRREFQEVLHRAAPVAELTAAANTGIIVATDIVHVRDAIERGV
jgi:hypothetical protein